MFILVSTIEMYDFYSEFTVKTQKTKTTTRASSQFILFLFYNHRALWKELTELLL